MELEAGVGPGLEERFPEVALRPGVGRRGEAQLLDAMERYYLLAMLVMYGMLAVAFKRWLQPLFVLIAIPLGFIGVVVGHLLFELDVSLMSGMGFVALSGVVVNDSLVLIVAINEARARGVSAMDAALEGCTTRFRPILLTSITTFLGVAPLVFETSLQAQFLIPMAAALGFGIVFATVILMVLVPSLAMLQWRAQRAVLSFFGRDSHDTDVPSHPHDEAPVHDRAETPSTGPTINGTGLSV